MKVKVDVYSKDIESSLHAFKTALENGATDISIYARNNYDTNEFEYINIMLQVDHKSYILELLDSGNFLTEPSEL